MSFSSGTYSLPAGNPVVTGTTISSTTHNNTESDIASALSTAILKDGTQTCTAAIPFVTGVTTTSTTFAVFNTTATTINAFGAATTLNVGNASGTANILGLQRFDDTTDSTSIITGSIQTDGGLGVTKAAWIGGLMNVAGAITAQSTINKVTLTAPATSATITIADTGSLITSGAYAVTLTATAATNVTLPTSGTLSNNFTKSFTSAGQTITSAGALTLAHSLGTAPVLIQIRLKCIAGGGEASYTQNQEVVIGPAGGTSGMGVSVIGSDATNLVVRFSNVANCFAIHDASSGVLTNLTNASWNVIFKAWA